uniref:Ig-like domain-containing protein n=1 Tax=Hucho hucho TaxID=62062 RepID=A0A4W5P4G4_9TELE
AVVGKFTLWITLTLGLGWVGVDSISSTRDLSLFLLGGTVTLTCFCPNVSVTRFNWFKQSLGQKPLHITSSLYVGEESYHSNNFIEDFTETKHLGLRRGDYSCNLTISKTEPGDSATYYCSTTSYFSYSLSSDSESNNKIVLQQPVSESVQPGDSVTLNCTIRTETCVGGHSVYWFRHGSGESRPGIIYTHGDRSDQCEKSPEAGSPTQSCVYNLPKRNLSPSDAGTYYCAVASCGEILFGNGTKLDIKAYIYLQFWFLLLLFEIQQTIEQTLFSWCPAWDQDGDNLHYVALNLSNKKNRSRGQRGHMKTVVYAGIRQ